MYGKMKFSNKMGCLTAIVPMAIGLMIIVTAIEISKNGYDYPVLIYAGLFISFVVIFFISLWFWDFLRSNLGLKKSR